MTGTTLLLNAAERRLQFGLCRDGELVCGQDLAAASQGAELLAPALADALKRLGLAFSTIDRIACVVGPGGFTGLRLALSTASALHHTLHIPLAGIDYLELLAEGAPCLPGQAVRVLTHARRELVYTQDFRRNEASHEADNGAGAVVPLTAPCVVTPRTALDLPLPSGAHPVVFVGSGVQRCMEAHALPAGAVHFFGLYDQPVWEAFIRLADRAVYGLSELSPMYLRASEAEDNLEALAERRGDNPAQARAVLNRLLEQAPVTAARDTTG